MINWPDELPDIQIGELTLRQWKSTDVDQVYLICQDPEVIEWTTIPVPYTREHAVEYVSNREKDYVDHSAISYVGESSGEAVIAVSLHHINEFDHWAEIGYWTAPAVRGKGLTSAAVAAVTELAFSIGIRRVHAIVDPANPASQGVLRKAGFAQEAIWRDGITRRDGTQSNALMFAKFPSV